jgi:hypothetical protein
VSGPNDVEQTVPRVELRDPEATEVALLRSLQRALLTHPVASQAAFTALVSEGRRFAETEEGRVWHERLIQSTLLKRARLVFDLTTLGLLEERAGNDVPSSYLDALFMAAASGDADDLLNRLFWSGDERHARGQTGN